MNHGKVNNTGTITGKKPDALQNFQFQMSSLSQKSSESSEKQLPDVPDVSAALTSKAEPSEILETVD